MSLTFQVFEFIVACLQDGILCSLNHLQRAGHSGASEKNVVSEYGTPARLKLFSIIFRIRIAIFGVPLYLRQAQMSMAIMHWNTLSPHEIVL